MEPISANRLIKEIVREIKEFETTLTPDMKVGLIWNGKILVIKRIINVFTFDVMVVDGHFAPEFPRQISPILLSECVPARVVLEPRLQGLTLTGVLCKDSEAQQKIGFSVQGQETVQD